MNKRIRLLLLTVIIFGSYFFQPLAVFSSSSEAFSLNAIKISFGSLDSTILYEDITFDPFTYQPNGVQIGTQKFAIICLRFNSSATRFTIPQLEDFYSSLETFWLNVSNFRLNVQCDVFGWYEFNMTFAEYNASSMNKWQLAHAAIDLADNDVDFTQYDCVQVLQGNIEFRGVSNVGKNTNRDTNDGKINVALSIVAENPSSSVDRLKGRIAHEMGHSIGFPHTHGGGNNGQKDYASYYNLMARMLPGAILGHQMYWKGTTPWYDHATSQHIILPGYSYTTFVDPRYIYDAIETQYLIVKITNSLYYRIEVVDRYSEDGWALDTGVLIYLVDKSNGESDCCTDMDSTPGSAAGLSDLKDCLWDVGQSFVDDVYNITINILSKDGDAFEVEVINEGSGFPDVMINLWGNPPGDPPAYESQDVWVDSMVNGWDNYKYGEYSSTGSFGDDPWANHENRLYARVNNIGEGLAQNVKVYFYEIVPMAAGGSDDWNIIGSATIPSINAGQSAVTFIPWTPEISLEKEEDGLMAYHSCILVTIEEQPGEIDTYNNKAQENIGYFEITSDESALSAKLVSSLFKPITTSVIINNPFNSVTDLYVQVLNVTDDWDVSGEGLGEFITFQPLETKEIEITITPLDEVRYMSKFEGYLYLGYEYIGIDDEDDDFIGDNHIENLGGTTIVATTCYQSILDLEASLRTGDLDIMGQISFEDGFPTAQFPQANAERTVLLQIENKDLDTFEYFTTQFDASGEFDLTFSILVEGSYSVKAFYAGAEFISTCSSETILVDTINSSIWTSGHSLLPGFEFYIVIGTIFFLAVSWTIRKVKNKKS
ncbi:MAG TPA: hypothetical protein VMX55_09185 [candidate division Zixibacteria bacterium]|nr:hypothetical protein [candidate division Zixibacteria bacterium]